MQQVYQQVTAALAAQYPPNGVPPLFDQVLTTFGGLIFNGYKRPYGIQFNIGAQHELDVLTITDTLLGLLGKPKTLVRFVEDRLGHDRRYAVDSSKLTRITGWKPAIAFEMGIRQTVQWYQANQPWWRAIKSGEFRTYYERMYGQRKVLGEVKA